MTIEELKKLSFSDHQHLLVSTIVPVLARLIHTGQIDPKTISRHEFVDALTTLGNTADDAFEVYITSVDEELSLVAHCISQGRSKSGVILLFTLIESEVNMLIRILMRVRNFSAPKITDALKGSSFDTKLDVILPLLGVQAPDRLRNSALQCRTIRNFAVHNKATPALWSDEENKASDGQIAEDKSRKFFLENPIESLKTDLQDFFTMSISGDPAIQQSAELLRKYSQQSESRSDA